MGRAVPCHPTEAVAYGAGRGCCGCQTTKVACRWQRAAPQHGGWGLEAFQSMLRWRGVHSSSASSSSASAAASISLRVGHEAGPGMVEASAPAQLARIMLRSRV